MSLATLSRYHNQKCVAVPYYVLKLMREQLTYVIVKRDPDSRERAFGCVPRERILVLFKPALIISMLSPCMNT